MEETTEEQVGQPNLNELLLKIKIAQKSHPARVEEGIKEFNDNVRGMMTIGIDLSKLLEYDRKIIEAQLESEDLDPLSYLTLKTQCMTKGNQPGTARRVKIHTERFNNEMQPVLEIPGDLLRAPWDVKVPAQAIISIMPATHIHKVSEAT